MSNIFRNCFWKICRQTAASSRLSNVRRYYIGFALWLVQKIGAPFQPIRWKLKQTTTKSLTFLRALGCLPIHNWVLQAKFNVFLYSLWSISHLPTSHHYDYLTTRVVFFFFLYSLSQTSWPCLLDWRLRQYRGLWSRKLQAMSQLRQKSRGLVRHLSIPNSCWYRTVF